MFLSLKKVINLLIFHTLNPWLRNLNTDFTIIAYCICKVKTSAPDKYKYSAYSIGFDSRSGFSLHMEDWEKMSLFLELIWAHQCILIIKIKYLNSWWRRNTRIRWYHINSRGYTSFKLYATKKKICIRSML